LPWEETPTTSLWIWQAETTPEIVSATSSPLTTNISASTWKPRHHIRKAGCSKICRTIAGWSSFLFW
jgi:hypothetical protein